MQCEHVLHSTMHPEGLESEPKSVSESVNVIKPLKVMLPAKGER